MDQVLALSTAGWVIAAIVFLCIWIALAFWPARVARRKDHSSSGYFIFSVFLFPLAVIIAYVVDDRTPMATG